jgi:hypothetical protein
MRYPDHQGPHSRRALRDYGFTPTARVSEAAWIFLSTFYSTSASDDDGLINMRNMPLIGRRESSAWLFTLTLGYDLRSWNQGQASQRSCVKSVLSSNVKPSGHSATLFRPAVYQYNDFGSGSAPMPNFEPDFGPVRKGSGPNHGSEPDFGNTNR